MSATPKNVTKKVVKASVHPTVAVMVKAAISSLKERKGSSLAAIKKYIAANYKGIDMVKIAGFIRRFLKKSVEDKSIVQVKGSYNLADKPKAEKKVKKPVAKKAQKATKKPAAKKAAKKPAAKSLTKKPVAKKAKKPAAKKPAKKSPKKTKKAAKK